MLTRPMLGPHAAAVLGANLMYLNLSPLLLNVLCATNFLHRCTDAVIKEDVEEVCVNKNNVNVD